MNLKKVRNFFLVILFSIALVGCTSDTSEKGKVVPTSGEEVSGGELNFAYHVQPTTLDPQFTTADATRDIAHHIFESLLTLSTSLEVQPMLAESYVVSEDRKEITFNLRKDIKFHNGKVMTAEDVVASLERWHELSSQARTYLSGTEYEIKDDHTVIAHIQDPTTLDLFIYADMTQFAAIMPKEIVQKAGSEGVDEYIGTGPYAFKEWKQDQHIHLTKFADYQSRSEPADGLSGEKKALLDDIYFHIVTDPSIRVTGLQSGLYDIASDIPPDTAQGYFERRQH